MFFQFDTKIAHLHTTAEFKLLPQVGSFCGIFQFTHRDLEKNTKNAHYLSQQICGQILCVFPIHPLWFGKKHKNCPLSGRGINAFFHGGQFLCDFPAHSLKKRNSRGKKVLGRKFENFSPHWGVPCPLCHWKNKICLKCHNSAHCFKGQNRAIFMCLRYQL